MTILQVTPERLVEHEVMPGEERHPRLNTIEAQRYIAGLGNGERARFEAMVDKNGEIDAAAQEHYMIQAWMMADDHDTIAGHKTSRALQSVRHLFETYLDKPQDEPQTERVEKRFYYPLLEMPKAPYIADHHWDQESRFRRGIGQLLSSLTDAPEWLTELQPLKRHEATPLEAQEYAFKAGRMIVQNVVQVQTEELAVDRRLTVDAKDLTLFKKGQPIGSRYMFAVAPPSEAPEQYLPIRAYGATSTDLV